MAQQRAIMQRTLASVGERLADGRRHLVGDSLTAADLAFVVLVAGYALYMQVEGMDNLIEAGPPPYPVR